MERATFEIAAGVHWVGVKDWDRRVFDALIPLPMGTSYNAYLVRGERKIALIDTVNPGFEGELLEKISRLADPQDIDYIVMNHAEPDHAGAIPVLIKASPKAKVLLTERGVELAQRLYRIPRERIHVVKDSEELDLGGKTLQFFETPFVHWPETMFTFLREEKVLFPCDFFGAHLAPGIYADQVPGIADHAQRYFGEIMMPFRQAAKRALERAKELDPSIIAPSHGPIWRDPKTILDLYQRWTAGETEAKVVVAHVSMWGSTERLVHKAVDELLSSEIQVVVHELSRVDVGELAKDLVDARGILVGSPTVLGGLHPAAAFALQLVRLLKPPLRYGLVFSSFGWGGGALRQAKEILSPTGIELVGTLEVQGRPTGEEEETARELAAELAARVKGG